MQNYPIYTTVVVGNLTPWRISPNPARVSIVFWSTSGNVAIHPGIENPPQGTGLLFQVASAPVVLGPDTAGVIPQIGWTITTTAASVNVFYIESIRIPDAPKPAEPSTYQARKRRR